MNFLRSWLNCTSKVKHCSSKHEDNFSSSVCAVKHPRFHRFFRSLLLPALKQTENEERKTLPSEAFRSLIYNAKWTKRRTWNRHQRSRQSKLKCLSTRSEILWLINIYFTLSAKHCSWNFIWTASCASFRNSMIQTHHLKALVETFSMTLLFSAILLICNSQAESAPNSLFNESCRFLVMKARSPVVKSCRKCSN